MYEIKAFYAGESIWIFQWLSLRITFFSVFKDVL